MYSGMDVTSPVCARLYIYPVYSSGYDSELNQVDTNVASSVGTREDVLLLQN